MNQKKVSTDAHKAMLFTTSTFRAGAIEFAAAHRIALIQVTADEVNYAVKSWLPGLKASLVVPDSDSLADYLFDYRLLERSPNLAESEEVRLQKFVLSILNERLDYQRILSSRGYEVDAQEIEDLKAEIAEEKAKLERMQRGGA